MMTSSDCSYFIAACTILTKTLNFLKFPALFVISSMYFYLKSPRQIKPCIFDSTSMIIRYYASKLPILKTDRDTMYSIYKKVRCHQSAAKLINDQFDLLRRLTLSLIEYDFLAYICER